MHEIIICDTSCFIILANIGEFRLLQQLYGQVVTTAAIAAEYGEALPDWVIIEAVKDITGNNFWSCR